MAVFTDDVVLKVWNKAFPEVNNDPNIWRKDYAGAWIRFDHYGKESLFGWEIDHLRPVSRGGTDVFDNLYPMHWKNNRKKADDYPVFSTEVTSDGVTNIEKIQSWRAE